VSGQREKLTEVETALALLRTSSADRERAAAQVEAELRAKLQEAEETVRNKVKLPWSTIWCSALEYFFFRAA
jgi:ribosomal protein L1